MESILLYIKIIEGIFGAKKKKNKLRWRDMTWILRQLCVRPWVDHGQQPMKMHTVVAFS